DLRRPHLHTLFGADNQIGLAQALDDGSAPRVYGVEGAPQMQLLTSWARSSTLSDEARARRAPLSGIPPCRWSPLTSHQAPLPSATNRLTRYPPEPLPGHFSAFSICARP